MDQLLLVDRRDLERAVPDVIRSRLPPVRTALIDQFLLGRIQYPGRGDQREVRRGILELEDKRLLVGRFHAVLHHRARRIHRRGVGDRHALEPILATDHIVEQRGVLAGGLRVAGAHRRVHEAIGGQRRAVAIGQIVT